MEDVDRAEARDEEAFEKGLALLLTRAYEPPAYREPFRDRLLGRLKQRQDELQSQRRERRRTLISFSASAAGIAAAVAIVVTAMGLRPPEAAPLRQDSAPDPTVVVAEAPVETPETSEAPVLPSNGFFASADAAALRVMDPMEVSTDRDTWTTVTPDKPVDLPDGGMLRVAAEDDGSAALWLRDGTRMGLRNGSCLRRDGEHVRLDQGGAYLVVGPSDPPLTLQLPRHRVEVMPGSEVYIKIYHDHRYAEGGEPAPRAAVIKGLAFAWDDRGAAPLFPDKLYALDQYVEPGYPAEPLSQQPGLSFTSQRPLLVSAMDGANRSAASFTTVRRAAATPTTATIDGRAFRLTDGRWADDSITAADPRIALPYLSESYLRFLREHPDLAPAFGLGNGKHVAVKYQGTVYEVTDP